MSSSISTRSIVGALAFAAALAAGTNAYADATLTLTPVSSQCTTWASRAGPGGYPIEWTSVSDCGPTASIWSAFAPGAGGGSGRYMRVVYDFAYADDGLLLEEPTQLAGVLLSSFETGALEIRIDGYGYNPSGPGILRSINYSPLEGTNLVGGNYLVLGGNDHPDEVSGRLTIELRVAPYNYQDSASVSVEVRPHVLSVAAIPEPSTYALMAVGLAAVGANAWRRRRSDRYAA